MTSEGAVALISSAACGADLIALEVAEELDMQRRIVLPFEPGRFRDTSVSDRPGSWGPLFDHFIDAAKTGDDLIVLADTAVSDAAAYASANERIVREAAACARAKLPPIRMVAVVVWEGAPKDGDDATMDFRTLAASAGFESREVLTR
jgi:hypothetical protein